MKCKDCACYKNKWCSMVTNSPDPDMERDCGHFIRAQRWIPVTARLPEFPGDYLVACSDLDDAMVAQYDNEDNFVRDTRKGWSYYSEYYESRQPLYTVTHWMPLPEPPEVSK